VQTEVFIRSMNSDTSTCRNTSWNLSSEFTSAAFCSASFWLAASAIWPKNNWSAALVDDVDQARK
jgi:hypothetical protein